MSGSADTPNHGEMVAASKEAPPPQSGGEVDGMTSIVYSALKQIVVVGTIYCVGYMNWSVAWLITPLIFSVMRDHWKKQSDLKRSIAMASAMSNEKDVILAKITDLPSWVYFPDVERCEWVNRILAQLWPKANGFARELVKDVIEPNVAAALAAYKLKGFKFDRIILGTISPRIGGIKVYDKNVRRDEIIMDVELFYTSDCDINFELAGLRGGVKHFQIQGLMRVVMKPLIDKIPLVGGLQVFFLNNPEVDFNLVGVADFLDLPGLSEILRKVVIQQIGAFMVLPNKLPITLNPDVLATSLKMPEPEGVLRIHVVGAKDLMKKDISMLGKGKSDPYAIVTVGSQSFRSETIDNTVNPKWDFWCEAAILAECGQNLHLQLMDKDDASDDEKLGRASVEISSVIKKGLLDTWLTLEEAKHGLVHVRLAWMTLSANPSDLPAALKETQMLRVTSMSTALVTVFLDSAHNLMHARPQSQPDPVLYITVGNQKQQTDLQMRTDSPIWEKGYTFLVSNPEHDSVYIRIVDQKTEKEIGQYTMPLSNLLDKPGMEIASQPYQLLKSGPESKIEMAFRMRILKKAPSEEDAPTSPRRSSITTISSGNTVSGTDTMSRTSSVRTNPEPSPNLTSRLSTLPKQDSKLSTHSYGAGDLSVDEAPTLKSTATDLSSSPPHSTHSSDLEASSSPVYRRTQSVTSSAGSYGLGRIQMTLRYSVQRQRLIVIIHKILNIPLKEPGNIPDPYVKLYLLPGRAKESKRKTKVIKDNCNPEYDENFEYIISMADLQTTDIEVTVATQKGFLSGGSPVIGMVKIPLNDPDFSNQGSTEWYDLSPEHPDKFE